MPSMAGRQHLQAGFAKLQGEDFEYVVQQYSVVLGRNSKKATVDFDLAERGGCMNISRQHARLFFDFQKGAFQLEVLGKNGVHVRGELRLPGGDPVGLRSQDLLQIGEKRFYFLLPTAAQRQGSPIGAPHGSSLENHQEAGDSLAGGRPLIGEDVPGDGPEEAGDGDLRQVKRRAGQDAGSAGELGGRAKGEDNAGPGSSSAAARGSAAPGRPPGGGRRAGEEIERAVLAAVNAILLNQDVPGAWMPMARLNAELTEAHQELYRAAQESGVMAPGRPAGEQPRPKAWAGLQALLARYPDAFAITLRMKGPKLVEHVRLQQVPQGTLEMES